MTLAFVSTFFLPLLGCFAPTLAFVSLNTRFFNTRQIVTSLIASAVLGAVASALLLALHAPDLLVCGVALLLFGLLSERLFTELLPNGLTRVATFGAVSAIMLGLTAWLGAIGGCIPLFIYTFFSALDLKKHWRQPKEIIFTAHNMSEQQTKTKAEPKGITLRHTPNIYILFLESLLSKHALEVLFHQDDAGLDTFLRENRFTVYENSLSNQTWTASSLSNILNMNHTYPILEGETPDSLHILHNNGYNISCFDSSPFVFSPYRNHVDAFLFTIPRYVEILYHWAIPLFAQSRYLRKLTLGIDPFETTIHFPTAFKHVRSYMDAPSFVDKPQCMFFRFGAKHSLIYNTWEDLAHWPENYRELYLPAVDDIKTTVNFINQRDPTALIVAVGDHGSGHYRNAWCGPHDANTMLRKRNIDPAMAALDFASVLLAVRWPDFCKAVQGRVAHVNLFREVFRALGGRSPLLDRLQPDVTLLMNERLPEPLCIARDGKPLAQWEIFDSAQQLELSLHDALLDSSSAEKQRILATTLLKQGRLAEATAIAENALLQHHDHIPLLKLAIELYCKRALAAQAEKHCKALLSLRQKDPTAQIWQAYVWILQAKYPQAQAMIDDYCAARPVTDSEACMAQLRLIQYRDGVEAALQFTRQAMQQQWAASDRLMLIDRVVVYLDHAGCDREALALLDREPVQDADDRDWGREIHRLRYLACVRLLDWPLLEQVCQQAQTVNYDIPACYRLYHAGALEMQGRLAAALEVLNEAVQNATDGQAFALHLGLFALRNKINDSRLYTLKKNALTFVRTKKENVLASGLFNAQWYTQRYGHILNGMDPLQHFAHFGSLLALDPCPYFNAAYYYHCQCDVAGYAIDPFLHYLTSHPHEDRDPSVAFATRAYLTQHPDAASWHPPLAHFLQTTQA